MLIASVHSSPEVELVAARAPTYQNEKSREQSLKRRSTVSDSMQKRLDKIDALIKRGYTLQRANKLYVEFTSTSNLRLNLLTPWNTPGGFSWIAFFFPYAVCFQIREWSFFYWLALLGTVGCVFPSILNDETIIYSSLILGYLYGCMFPFFRYLAITEGRKEWPRWSSYIGGWIMIYASITPGIVIYNLLNH